MVSKLTLECGQPIACFHHPKLRLACTGWLKLLKASALDTDCHSWQCECYVKVLYRMGKASTPGCRE